MLVSRVRHNRSSLVAGALASMLTAVVAAQPASPSLDERQISMYVREVFQDRDGVYWFGTNGDGVCRYDGAGLTYFNVGEGFGGEAVRGIVQDDGGALWFATNRGVTRYASGVFTNYTSAHGLSDDSVWSILCDRAGTIWAGTHEGVCRFAVGAESFEPFPLPRVEVEHPESRFSPKVVFAMHEDRTGAIWFGTDGEGAHRYDGASFTTFTTADGLAGNLVRAITGDRRGRIWIGTDGGGASRYDGATFRNFDAGDGLSNCRIFEILEDRAGNMWFSTLGAGACRWDGTTFTAFREDHDLVLFDRPARSHVQEFFEDRDGVLWIGCSGGLFRFDGATFVNVTKDGPWPERRDARATDAMAPFARMMGGEWRMVSAGRWVQATTWRWGPGRCSVVAQTHGHDAEKEPWRVLRVFYWHPGRREVRLLGLSTFARGVSDGAMRFEGDSAEAIYDLDQTMGRRDMLLRWTFDGPDSYHDALLENDGSGYEPLAAWDLERAAELSPIAAAPPDDMMPPAPLDVLAPLLGRTWRTTSDGTARDARDVEATVEWIPYCEAIHVRARAANETGEAALLLEAVIHHHVRTGTVRCLALSRSGGVYEGDVTVLDGGGLRLDLTGYEDDATAPRTVRIDVEEDGTRRVRAWTGDDVDRAPALDVRLQAVDAPSP